MTVRSKRFKVILESRRVSFRVRTLRRPYQINLTITRYIPQRHIKGVS